MSGSVGSQIAAVDYDSIRAKVLALLGTGSADKGYGQSVASADVNTGQTITKAQWDALRYDLMSIKYHQDGVMPDIVEIQKTDPIRYGSGHPNLDYNVLADQATLTRFNVGIGQFAVSSKASQTYSSLWAVQANATLTVTFGNANQGRYFFNSGGSIRLTSTRTGGSISLQNAAWTAILSTVGTIAFDADQTKQLSYYTLTNSYQLFKYLASSAPYSNSYYQVEVKSNVASNINGTATELTFKISWVDAYIDPDSLTGLVNPPGDGVDGTLSLTVEEAKAAGTLFPSGTFTITSPTYSLSTITAT